MSREVRIGAGIIGAGFARSTFEDGWRNQLVLDAARRSHEARRWVVP
jgi:hypothetical protein